jgi:hypothetical protein
MAKSSKGGVFEREFCRTLSLWWSGGADDSLFWRTASSGGRAKRRGRLGKRTASHHGDICATNGEGQSFIDLFTVELKRGYSRATIIDLLDKPDRAAAQTYELWLDQAKESASQAGTPYWLIVHKRDKRSPLVLVEWEALSLCSEEAIDDTGVLTWQPATGLPVVVTTLEKFLSGMSPRCVREL